MTGIRRAFLWASLGRYLVLTVNLAAAAVMARLLSPDEYGVSVLGGAVFAVVEAIRALGGGAYLIRKKELRVRTMSAPSFTVGRLGDDRADSGADAAVGTADRVFWDA